jgi:hypothetical protein
MFPKVAFGGRTSGEPHGWTGVSHGIGSPEARLPKCLFIRLGSASRLRRYR